MLQGVSQLRPISSTRSLWNGWKLGFSSSSAAQQEDKQQAKAGEAAAAGGQTAAAEGGAAEGEAAAAAEQPQATAEELQAALAECQASLEAEAKKVSHHGSRSFSGLKKETYYHCYFSPYFSLIIIFFTFQLILYTNAGG